MNEAGRGTTGGRRRRRNSNFQFLSRICEVDFPAVTNLVTISSTDSNHANYAAQLVGVTPFVQNTCCAQNVKTMRHLDAFKGVLHLYLKLSMFCVLYQNHQHSFEI